MRQSFPAGLFYLQPAYCAVPAATHQGGQGSFFEGLSSYPSHVGWGPFPLGPGTVSTVSLQRAGCKAAAPESKDSCKEVLRSHLPQ